MISTVLGNIIHCQLLNTIDFSLHLDFGAQIDAIFLDFSKAFDKVPHQRLFLKLSHYGIQGALLPWIKVV